ncbi:MAG: DUF814 domain-containing protein [Spirochaetales bacterium]|nr:DUF814 domain-containing protein [Candidatus Physcosoma equi]
MGVNWKELELLLSELPLEDSYIQKITEHDVHSFTMHLFHKTEKAWMLYVEIASNHTRICKTERLRGKSKETQRFTQYLKAHLIGRRIKGVQQLPFDRAFVLTLENSEDTVKMVFRLYSGPGANIIMTDEEDKILELLFRRPQRGEAKGDTLLYEIRENEGKKHFEVRPYDTESFNAFIDKEESRAAKEDKTEEVTALLLERRDRELAALEETLRRQKEREEKTKGYEELKHAADVLSASIWSIRKGMTSITLDDWERGVKLTLPLEPDLSPNENLERYYTRYRKDKKSSELAHEEVLKCEEELQERKRHWEEILAGNTPLEKLKKELSGTASTKEEHIKEGRPGVYVKSNGWDLIVGRNAKENDEILRSYTRGSDLWMHTRDFAGGYVIIKAQRDKTVPLPVLLDAASLAIVFSKARKNGKADLYYTEVKYLRRVKGGKTGLVLPTQEKNLVGTLDEERVRRLLGER